MSDQLEKEEQEPRWLGVQTTDYAGLEGNHTESSEGSEVYTVSCLGNTNTYIGAR